MREPIEATGRTVEEAIDDALERLGLREDEVEIRVLSEGLGEPARVLVGARDERDPDELDRGELDPNAAEPFDADTIEPEGAEDGAGVERVATKEEIEAQADIVEDFLNGLLDRMDVDADVDVIVEAAGVLAELDGEDSGLLIGRHGATIEAIQEITRSVVKAKTGNWPNVIVDVEGYRARRQEQLESKARRLADKVIRSGRAVEMPPMLSSERKIVHQVLTTMSGVRTESAGTGPDRHIVIHPA